LNKKENLIKTINHQEPEWIPYVGEGSWKFVYPSFSEREKEGGYDGWGFLWEFSPVTGSYPSHNYLIRDIEDIYHFKIPDPYIPDMLNEAKREMEKTNREDTLIIGYTPLGIFTRSWFLMGMENYLMALITDKEAIIELHKKIADFKIAICERFIDELDVDAVWVSDDWGTTKDLFISPELWRETIKPQQRRICNSVKNRGKILFQHSCGKVESILGDMIDLGIDVWNPCQPCNDLGGLKKKHGDKITFMGGIDSLIVDTGTPDDVRREVLYRIDTMAGKDGFIIEPSHWVKFPEENLDMMNQTAKDYGKYICKS